MLRFTRTFHKSAIRKLAAGDAVPPVLLQNGAPSQTINLAQETNDGRHLIVGVPGAFSPGCSKRHIPEYMRSTKELQKKGIQRLFVVTVNDSFVTDAWKASLLETAKTPEAEGFAEVLADSTGDFSREWEVLFDATAFFGNPRSCRYAALVENGKVVKAFVEKDNTGIADSAASNVLQHI